MMLALWTAVTLRRLLARAYSKANLTMRRLAATEMYLMLIAESLLELLVPVCAIDEVDQFVHSC